MTVNKHKFHLRLRKTHRYLGVFLGVQFFFWTVGGLYFSWTKIDEIRGDNLRKEAPLFSTKVDLVSPSVAVQKLQEKTPIDSLIAMQLIDILGQLHYQIIYKSGKEKKTQLAHAQTGELRPALVEAEALALAKSRLNAVAEMEKSEYLTSTNGHHEYREKPLPAYAFTFGKPLNTTVYVAAEQGTVQSFRNNQWRIFDFLWMLHVMDFESRDNINNWLLRIFSVIGLLTIFSGFTLFFVSSKSLRLK